MIGNAPKSKKRNFRQYEKELQELQKEINPNDDDASSKEEEPKPKPTAKRYFKPYGRNRK